MSDPRETFDGWLGGAAYDVVARATGYGPEYYRRAASAIPVRPGMTVLDLGCGTGSLSLALGERMRGRGRIVGIDLSERQLERARAKVGASSVPIELRRASIRELPFADASIDGVTASQVFHGLPEEVLLAAVGAVARVLRPGGFFALVEWSRPRLGTTALVWLLTLLGSRGTRNWKGGYPELVRASGLELATDVYLDSLSESVSGLPPDVIASLDPENETNVHLIARLLG